MVLATAFFIWYRSIARWFYGRSLQRASDINGSNETINEKTAPQPKKKRNLEDEFTIVTLPNTPSTPQPTCTVTILPWYKRVFNFRGEKSDAQRTVVHVQVDRVAEVNGEARTPLRWSRFTFVGAPGAQKPVDVEAIIPPVPTKPLRTAQFARASVGRSLSASSRGSENDARIARVEGKVNIIHL